MKSIILFLILVLAGLQYKLWFSDDGVFEWLNLEKKIEAQAKENEKLLLRNRAMEADIVELKSGNQALEEQARFELGMVKDTEVYYHFVD